MTHAASSLVASSASPSVPPTSALSLTCSPGREERKRTTATTESIPETKHQMMRTNWQHKLYIMHVYIYIYIIIYAPLLSPSVWPARIQMRRSS